ncbi:MAG: hypothetical protein A3J38_05645 [Gammaproteobacteria bacterium RIFCSPHIGHO2_12_FULL_45_9]|nr:MAG: hypothetical protein A3J38_05645 [Gammaproteobacteria bacterium RIFCSPHIGHO2_12_FULL_45_9]
MKSLQYNLKYAQVQQDLSTSDSDPTRRMLAKRDLFLLKQASTLSGKHRYQYRIAQFFTAKPKPQLAELQQLDGKIVSGATIDDYQRIKIASFILSSLVRNQYYQQLMLENPGVTAYLGIAQAMGECIDFKEDAPEINKILSCPLILGSNLQHYAHTKQMLDSAYQTALQTVAGKIP